jgi:hypothetical protein
MWVSWVSTHETRVKAVSPFEGCETPFRTAMSAQNALPPGQLAELLVSAASQLVDPSPSRSALARRGRLHLGRLRPLLARDESVAVVAGFSTGCWLGRRDGAVPDLGRFVYGNETRVDDRGRVVLDLRVRAWLAVDDPKAFDLVTVPAADGGILVVPVEEFARRCEVIAR